MKAHHGMSSAEIGMRVVLAVQKAAQRNPSWLMSDLARTLQERYGISKATAFRRIRQATDVLAIAYDDDPVRAAKKGELIAEGRWRASVCVTTNSRRRRFSQ